MIDQQATYSEELYLITGQATVILSTPWNEVPEADRQLLQKILQSVRLNLAAVRILHQPILNLAQLTPQPPRTIYFGEPVNGLTQYEVIKTEGIVVLAPNLSQLQSDPTGKQKLWIALKSMFGL